MPYLLSDISDDTELLPVNAALSNPTYPLFYDLASETVKVLAGANTTEWQVARGVGNTQAVRHSRGTPLILNSSPFGGGGGGVTVDNTVDPPFTAETLVAAGATESPSGTAILPLVTVSTADPGAIGPNRFWLFTDPTTLDHGNYFQLYLRNDANNGWLKVGVADDDSGGGIVLTVFGHDPDPWYSWARFTMLGGASGQASIQVMDVGGSQVASLGLTQTGAALVGGGHSLELDATGLKLDTSLPIGTQAAAVSDLAGGATLPQTVTKVNDLLAALRASELLAP